MPRDSAALRVLIVEDEPLMRWSLAQTVADAGHIASEAADCATALAAVAGATRPFDVVLLDLDLPDCRDLTSVDRLRQVSPSSAIILITAFGTPDVIAGARARGASVLSKPFDISIVPDALVNASCGLKC